MAECSDPSGKDFKLEIYRQKYEVFRHFDSLRWHIPTFSLGAGSLLLGFAAKEGQTPAWWAFCVFGVLSLFSSFAIYRVRKGLHKNHEALSAIACIIGDNYIPKTQKRFGATWWLCIIFLMLGIASIMAGGYLR